MLAERGSSRIDSELLLMKKKKTVCVNLAWGSFELGATRNEEVLVQVSEQEKMLKIIYIIRYFLNVASAERGGGLRYLL